MSITDLPEGINAMDATILKAFREVANTLPTTPAVLAWISRCLDAQSSERENQPSVPPSPTAPAVDGTTSGTTTDYISALSPSPEDTGHTLRLKRSRSSSNSLTPPLRAIDRNSTSGPSTSRVRTSVPVRNGSTHSLARPYEEGRPRVSREFLAALVKGIAFDKVREALRWASQQWPENPALPKEGCRPMARLLLETALAHESLEKRVIGESPIKLIMACVPGGDFEEMCGHFVTRAEYLEGERLPRSDRTITRTAANSLGNAVDEMLCTMSEVLPSMETFDAKAACLRSTTAILSILLARCNDNNRMETHLKWEYAARWKDHIRTTMAVMTDAELTRMRRTSYTDLLLSVRKSIAVFREREAAERLRQQHELEKLRQEQEQQQRQRQVDRDALREAHPDYRPSPSPRPPPPSQPNVYVMWPGFEEKTMVYFADRTGGWDEAWD
ncbi:hypothetical protein A1Q1_02544 [Trichosporon asahii var. asahii CBS 2479]|uniref:Uncharacterized protein n=1 Tax=Trichosporon asahii var. asahii (strain ATCC 90039 / CBS 2479 / JCM 2466 / KCTC 7840 / NBRC 103889/ NCYC 2677 / UAMH 7654) TaxID=1186058 RepID=J6EZW0_TRIAS|nr:hypothetical protein A1Q1_02544 [Trichosporon asahii var. asahii CBS 2479]EJT48412.1 hypothetical protein A1Q1_02544 [Trichosporon asahii var. asahii CBS 2479]